MKKHFFHIFRMLKFVPTYVHYFLLTGATRASKITLTFRNFRVKHFDSQFESHISQPPGPRKMFSRQILIRYDLTCNIKLIFLFLAQKNKKELNQVNK